jgi:hypothetical protein
VNVQNKEMKEGNTQFGADSPPNIKRERVASSYPMELPLLGGGGVPVVRPESLIHWRGGNTMLDDGVCAARTCKECENNRESERRAERIGHEERPAIGRWYWSQL